MRVRREETDQYTPSEQDLWDEEDEAFLAQKRKVRKRLEEKLEHRRLRHEIEDYDEDYDWDDDDQDRL
ncbi:MAG: hypothetical protein A3F18_05355 [Legionellales bacterium RIFCSPHIGHO2_12_FULL_37_14]|nr:MAG: hypothetical protein A3F18_05355 [Legionellales bacterium RIFCSPHIGHO2_12_FULL_37_14]